MIKHFLSILSCHSNPESKHLYIYIKEKKCKFMQKGLTSFSFLYRSVDAYETVTTKSMVFTRIKTN